MPYKEEKIFIDPEGGDYLLWRYIDFTKLVSLLQKQSLFFPSVRTLREIDPWEGKWPKKSLLNIEEGYGLQKKELDLEGDDDITEITKTATEGGINSTFINCWHYNNNESAALWRLYLKSNEGICIRSNLASFKKSFDKFDVNVNCGKVNYIDYGKEDLYDNEFSPNLVIVNLPLIFKREIYKHEIEYRAIIKIEKEKHNVYDMTEKGVFVPVLLELLIDEIVVAPASPKWFLELVKDMVKNFNLEKNVRRSIVDDRPY